MGNGGCGQLITLCLCRSFLPPQGGLLTLFPCSNMGSLSQETVLHKLLQCESFPRAAILHELPQWGSLPQGAVLQEQTAPAWVPHRVTSPASKPAPVWAPLSTGPQVLPAKIPHGVTASFRHPPAPACGPFHGLQVDTCSTMDLHGLQADSLPPHELHHGLQGKIFSPAPGAPAFTDLGVCRVVSLT